MNRENTSFMSRVKASPVFLIITGFIFYVVICQILFQLLPQVFEQLANIPKGYAQLIAALIIIPFALWFYKTILSQKLEGRITTPEISSNSHNKKWLVLGLILGIGMVVAYIGALKITDHATISAKPSLAQGFAAAIALGLFAGVVEELFARGTLLRVTENHLGTIAALLVSVAVFAVQHASNPNASIMSTAAIAIEGGLMLGALYVLSRSLWAVFGVHFGWNFVQTLLSLPVSGHEMVGAYNVNIPSNFLSGGSFGIEVSKIIIVAWLGLAILFLILAVKKNRFVSFTQARQLIK